MAPPLHSKTAFIGRRKLMNRGRKGRHITVVDEKGKIVFQGKGRRKYKERVFFDSEITKRVFHINPKRISKKRLEELRAKGIIKRDFGRDLFVDQRNPKHKKIYR